MKTPHALFAVTMTIVVLANTPAIFAQSTFDGKKKQTMSVNTSALQALRVNGSGNRRISNGRYGVTSKTQPTSFPKPQIQVRKPNIFYSEKTGLPSFIITPRNLGSVRTGSAKDIATAYKNYLEELKPALNLTRDDISFFVREIKTKADNRTRVRLVQQYKNVPVYGAELVVHLDRDGKGESFNGTYYNIEENIDTTPAISLSSAVDIVSAHFPRHILSESELELVQYEKPNTTLCLYQDKGLIKKFVLAYHIVSTPSVQQRMESFVDANTGKVLHEFSSICFVDGPKTTTAADLNGVTQTIHTFQKGANYFAIDVSKSMFNGTASVLPDAPVGGIMTIDMNNTFGDNAVIKHLSTTDNVWNSDNFKKAVSAHYNAGIAYDYFEAKHSRNSIDGAGGTIISIINVTDETGGLLDNAFWNGKAMFYGNGKNGFKPLAGSLDVAGHEMTHGVVQNTANLEYQGESGAINESMADIFGTMLDPADWLIGEDVVKTSVFPSGALRSLQDPHNGGTSLADQGYQPRHKNEMYTGSEDNGGVHINSGLPNNAFFRYAEAVTRDKAAAVFYKALDDYLTKSSQFIDLRLAVVKAAGDLFGAGSNEVTQAGIAFDAVGIANGQAGDYTETLPGNPGTEFFLIYNTDAADANTLYRTTLDATTVAPLSQTDFISRPSVTDDGSFAVFVGSDNKIHALNTKPGEAPEEVIVQNEAIWSNVVVSKGGTKLAAVTTAQDATIYVYDFNSEEWAEFTLYSPTYSEGINSGGPVYADALEWDYDGQVLVYDCFNRINNNDGADIEYWDVNFIQVWDNTTNDFSDGTIAKLFPSLPPDVSIGNPSFSKVSPYIIAFDYFDVSTDEYAVLGCNIETNDVNVIASNNSLGWPSYNKADSRIAYTSMDGAAYTTNYILINADKISSSSAAVGLFTDAKWPVYFSTGEREIGDQVVTGILDPTQENVPITCYPNPVADQVSVSFFNPPSADTRIQLISASGQDVYQAQQPTVVQGSLIIDLNKLASGYYLLFVSNIRVKGACRIFKR